jgi:hypothetical protein
MSSWGVENRVDARGWCLRRPNQPTHVRGHAGAPRWRNSSDATIPDDQDVAGTANAIVRTEIES